MDEGINPESLRLVIVELNDIAAVLDQNDLKDEKLYREQFDKLYKEIEKLEELHMPKVKYVLSERDFDDLCSYIEKFDTAGVRDYTETENISDHDKNLLRIYSILDDAERREERNED